MILNNEASRYLMGWKPVNKRILTVRFKSCHSKKPLYRFMLQKKRQKKKKKMIFITHCKTLNEISKHDIKMLMGDINAQISRNRDDFKQMIIWFSITY